ncbi:hypothetical protein FQN60_006628 [Etheostoma spectabile]|uniref:Uncharacterized protein n=1 Tax=Etheostoma spectabile TaxID=54343 RepID=A0A5J5CER3_9PERO|nr:hypothetical protein FQN60_006628 [Etheostoma spectabile]
MLHSLYLLLLERQQHSKLHEGHQSQQLGPRQSDSMCLDNMWSPGPAHCSQILLLLFTTLAVEWNRLQPASPHAILSADTLSQPFQINPEHDLDDSLSFVCMWVTVAQIRSSVWLRSRASASLGLTLVPVPVYLLSGMWSYLTAGSLATDHDGKQPEHCSVSLCPLLGTVFIAAPCSED